MGSKASKQQPDGDDEKYLPRDDDWPWVWAIRNPEVLDWKRDCVTPEEIQEIALRQSELPVRVNDQLYYGDASCVHDAKRLRSLGITHVLNVASGSGSFEAVEAAVKSAGIGYHSVPTEDEFDYPLLEKHWEDISATLHNITRESTSNKVVVHCVAGMNRSGLVVAAWHMLHTRTPVLETVKHIRRRRGNVALQNEGFQEQLVALARRRDLLGGAPGTADSSLLPAVRVMPRTTDWWMQRDGRLRRSPRANPLNRLAQ